MILLGFLVLSLSTYLVLAGIKQQRHYRLMRRIPLRIHVNGIRGKSSVTRLIAGALREADITTIAKTTGTAARLITDHQDETPIERRAPDIAEQHRTLATTVRATPNVGAVVFECMAINPLYQSYLEQKIMHSNIGIITNVREDHMDMLGKTLPEIARSLASTVPLKGHLVTAEEDEELTRIFAEICRDQGTVLHVVSGDTVSTEEIRTFGHFEFKQNVAIAIRVAELAGIDRDTALQGMWCALPDPGAFKVEKLTRGGTTLYWVNLFAVNDRESFVHTVDLVTGQLGRELPRAVILNNREDRPERVTQFLDISTRDIGADVLFTFGAYERQVARELQAFTGPKPRLVQLGDSSPHSGDSGSALLDRIAAECPDDASILFGAANIHTNQATALLHALEYQGDR